MPGYKAAQGVDELFYVTRPSGARVSLVPADLLPKGMVIAGYPRFLKETDLKGRVCLDSKERGSKERKNWRTVDEKESAPPVAPFFSVAESVASQEEKRDRTLSSNWRSPPVMSEYQSNDPKPSILKQGSSDKRKISSSCQKVATQVKDPEEKPTAENICHYWFRTGQCDFSNSKTGCYNYHYMPTTMEGLEEIGKREWPSWWKRENPKYADYCWSWVRTGKCNWSNANPTICCRHFHRMPECMQEYKRGGMNEVPAWFLADNPGFKIKNEGDIVGNFASKDWRRGEERSPETDSSKSQPNPP